MASSIFQSSRLPRPLQRYDRALRATQLELGFCDRTLGWETGDSILDAPTGAGRHAIELAKRGHTVTGLDLSPYLLSQAKRQCHDTFEAEQQRPVFVRGLMQRLPFQTGRFKFIICLFSSFGYGESEEENQIVMNEFARVLRPGGKVLIDVMNRHYIVPRLNKVYESVREGLSVIEERTLSQNKRRLRNQITVKDTNGNKRRYIYKPWLFNGWELSWHAAKAGLTVNGIYGNFSREAYHVESERAMLTAQKPII